MTDVSSSPPPSRQDHLRFHATADRLPLKLSEDPTKGISLSSHTALALMKLLPLVPHLTLVTDVGSPSIFEALVPCLTELCASASYPFPYHPITPLLKTADPLALSSHLRPILIGISLRLHRLLTVIVLSDKAFADTGGVSSSSIQVISSLPKDTEMDRPFELLRKITASVFILVVHVDGAFHPLIVSLTRDKKDLWHRYLTGNEIDLVSPEGRLQVYAKGLPSTQ